MEITTTYQIENPKGEIKAIILMEGLNLAFNREFYLEFSKFKDAEVSFWDNWAFIKALYKDLKKGKKHTSRIEALEEDIATLSLTKKEVRKFLKKAFKILKTFNDKKTTRLH